MHGRKFILAAALIGIAIALLYLQSGLQQTEGEDEPVITEVPAVEYLFERRQSNQFVELEGQVVRVLEGRYRGLASSTPDCST